MVIKNGKEVKVKTKSGYEYKYTYTSLADIQNALDEKGQRYYQEVMTRDNGSQYIKTIIYDTNNKILRECIGCDVFVADVVNGNKMQMYGAGLSYARRYSLLMAFGISTTDDDNENLYGDNDKKTKKAETTQKVNSTQLEIIKNQLNQLNLPVEDKKKLMKDYNFTTLESLTKDNAEKLIDHLGRIEKAQEVKNG